MIIHQMVVYINESPKNKWLKTNQYICYRMCRDFSLRILKNDYKTKPTRGARIAQKMKYPLTSMKTSDLKHNCLTVEALKD